MSQKVAEYLGVAVTPGMLLPLVDSTLKPDVACPFRQGNCTKAGKGYVPVCSLRNSTTDEIWIVCEHRLCSTQPKGEPLTAYQVAILQEILNTIVPHAPAGTIPAFQREGRVRRKPGENQPNDSHADFKIVFLDSELGPTQLSPVLLEMQGGGETASTGDMTKVVRSWESAGDPDPTPLVETVLGSVNPIPTNAWRRQQEQFLFKGRTAVLSGGRLAFAMGGLLYDWLMNNLTNMPANLAPNSGWNLAILGFAEHPGGTRIGESLGMIVDPERQLFTTFDAFVASVSSQGQGDSELFSGQFMTTDGTLLELP